jgi:hypothetical protein
VQVFIFIIRGPIGKARTKSFTDKRSCIIASSFFLPETDVLFKKILTQEVLQNIVNLIPEM